MRVANNITPGNKKELKRLLRKRMFVVIIPNVIINTCIPYFSFTNKHAVFLFEGQQNLARFLLPMSLLLPFIITFDILNRAILLSAKADAGIALNEKINNKKFVFQMATVNSLCTVLIIFTVMLAIHLSFPKHYSFDGALLAVIVGALAGVFSVIFTYLPVKRIMTVYNSQ